MPAKTQTRVKSVTNVKVRKETRGQMGAICAICEIAVQVCL